MSLIDERGRLFGRVNVIDFIVAVLVLGLLPLGYGGYLLFRVPDPRITSISPDQVVEHQPATLLLIGENLRPFLDVRFGAAHSDGVFVQSSNRAEVRVPTILPVGTYDVSVLEQERVLFSKPGGLTVLGKQWSSSVDTEVQVAGKFVGLTAEEAGALAVGSKFAVTKDALTVAEVLAVRPPAPSTQRVKVADNGFVTVKLPGQVVVPAVIRLHCTLMKTECTFGETVVERDTALILPRPAGSRSLRYLIDEVRPADARPIFQASSPGSPAVASVRVRFAAAPEVVAVMKVGDVDIPGAGVVTEADRAVLTEIGADRHATTIAAVFTAGNVSRQLQQPAVAFTGTLRVPVVYAPSGWTYKERTIKVGAGFQFETISGVMTGWIVDVRLGSER